MAKPRTTFEDPRTTIERLTSEDPQFRDARPADDISAILTDPGVGLGPAVARVFDSYADRPALAERTTEPVTDPGSGRTSLRRLPGFTTTSYGQLWSRVCAAAAEWHHDAETPVRTGDFVTLLGFTSGDYATLDLTCLYLGAVAVPLQPSASTAQVRPILEETGPRLLAVGIDYLDHAVDLLRTTDVRPRVVVFDYHPEDDGQRETLAAATDRLTALGVPAVHTLAGVLDRGAALERAPLFEAADGENPLRLLIYTSGSTGAPKGAMYAEGQLRALWRGWLPKAPGLPVLSVNFMPMSHVAGRAILTETLGNGGTAFFTASPDLSTLFEDIALARPTKLMLVPRICDMVYQDYQRETDRRADEFADREAAETAVAQRIREEVFGGRVVEALCGSAPLSAEIEAVMEDILRVRLQDGYGSTEAGVVLQDHEIVRSEVDDYTLVDVPELGYYRSDSPHPRGELLVKTVNMFPGYYKRPEVTASVFTEDGFYRTGDVMAQTGPDRLVYVDRRNNVLKLAQGEFVAVSRLEATFASSPLVRQIYVYGSSERSFLLAVVVPTASAVDRAADESDLKTRIGESLQRVAGEAGLQSYELPRDFLVEHEPFTVENGLLSDIRKLLRPRLKEHYGERLEQLYDDLERGRADQLRDLRTGSADRPVLETVGRAAQALLGCADADVSPDARFIALGGDSLSALSFATLLQETFGVEVPVRVVISPANDLRAIASYVETQRAGGTGRPSFAAVHGAGATEARAADLTLDRFLDADTLAAAPGLPRPAGQPRTVLLTGANGFLGRFMCLDWLGRLAETGGTLICLVRGADADAARARLDEAFDTGDAELSRRYRELAADRLEVLPGDLGEERFGLDEPTWQRLAARVDLVMHPAALVNHVLPYAELFGPNVLGTAEVIRLALTTRLKPVSYLSTVGVAAGLDPATLDESGDIRTLSPVRRLDESYANGYSTSKWGGEVLLREAHEHCGLPVSVFRSDMIMTHSRYSGQLNVPDMFTRMIVTLLTTGIAPGSFYRGDGRRAHYDGLPVDFTAEAIDTLGADNTGAYRTFNVTNPHDDGISFDTFVDWLVEAGYPIQRVDDYDDWFHRLDTAVHALPARQRQHSLLPLLHGFREPEASVAGSLIPAQRFREAVQEAKIGADGDIPHLSADLIAKYAADVERRELI